MMATFVQTRLCRHGWLACAVLLAGVAASAHAQLFSGLISQNQAASVGLKRAWFARAEVDPSRSRVVDWILSGDQLLILTDAGVLHALDANTGKTNWVTQFGNPNYPSVGPDANDKFVAVINGSKVYLMDRASGRILGERMIGGIPGAGPAVGENYVFVPTINGLIEGFPLELDAPQYRRWFYQSFGRILAPPLVTPESIAWTTDRGNLYVSGAVKPGVRFRLETSGKFDARAAYRAPLIYAIALSGELFAVNELNGTLAWRYMTGYPTNRAPAAVAERLFVSSEEPMLHCVDASTGLPQWRALGISQFAAVTKSHVYGVDRYGTIHILNIADGAPVGRIPTGGVLNALVNDQTDRLFLISESGMVQCLYEIGAEEPTYYAKPPVKSEAEPKPEGGEEYRGDGQPATAPAAAPVAEPAAPAPKAVPPAAESNQENPFGESTQQPAPAAEGTDFGTEDENPFD
jgi:outer membrane protein assembly factor BamB